MPEAPAPSAAQEPARASVRERVEVPAQVPDLELGLEPGLELSFACSPAWRVAPPASARRVLLQELKSPAQWLAAANCCRPPSRLDRRRDRLSEWPGARPGVLRALCFLQSGAASVRQHDRNLNLPARAKHLHRDVVAMAANAKIDTRGTKLQITEHDFIKERR